jgi:hypothetical protein
MALDRSIVAPLPSMTIGLLTHRQRRWTVGRIVDDDMRVDVRRGAHVDHVGSVAGRAFPDRHAGGRVGVRRDDRFAQCAEPIVRIDLRAGMIDHDTGDNGREPYGLLIVFSRIAVVGDRVWIGVVRGAHLGDHVDRGRARDASHDRQRLDRAVGHRAERPDAGGGVIARRRTRRHEREPGRQLNARRDTGRAQRTGVLHGGGERDVGVHRGLRRARLKTKSQVGQERCEDDRGAGRPRRWRCCRDSSRGPAVTRRSLPRSR